MNLLNNPLTHAFLDDMAEIGAFKWGTWAFVLMLITVTVADSIIPFGYIIGVIMTLNLAVATFVTYWWENYGREKYAFTSVMDLAEQMGRDTND